MSVVSDVRSFLKNIFIIFPREAKRWINFIAYSSFFSTFVCPTEIIAFSDRISEFKKLDVAVMACSTDSHFSHLAWVNTDRKMGGLGQMNIPILADTNHAISKAYGVLKEDEGIAYRYVFFDMSKM